LAFEGPGIFVIESHHNRIEDNRVSRNGGTGLVQLGSRDNRIEQNAFFANGDGGLFLGASEASGSEGNRVTRNLAVRNAFAGIAIEADRTEVSRNQILHNEEGIIVTGNANTVSRNHVAEVGGCPDCGVGISFEGGTQNVIERNLVSETAQAGIRMAAFEPETPPAVDNTVRGNLVRHAGTDGILVEPTATETLLERNFAFDATDDGIDVDNPTSRLRRNTANNNGDLGIEAIAGVTDLGGNRASGNGSTLQCANVLCQ
jgi:parallel beta-helix repeat protein